MTATAKPAAVHDVRGIPVHSGDVIKIYHFTGSRRKKYYIYKMVALIDGYWHGVSIGDIPGHADWTKAHKFVLQWVDDEFEIVEGHGPKPYISFEDRPRIKKANVSA